MEKSIYRYTLRHSSRQQLALVLLTLAAFPFLYLSLELPKIIINEAIGGSDFPREILGRDFDQIPFLLLLCLVFLSLVLANGAFKFVINVYKGAVGERMLRRLRYQLFARILRFPPAQFRKLSQGEVVSMIAGETEPLGGFIGDSISLPAFQGGTLLTILVFMFVQDPVLGTAAVALYPVQAYLIPKLQRQVNALRKQRVVKVRKLSERIGEVVGGVQDVHANDGSRYELADFSARCGDIYAIQFAIFKKKFFIKFLNNFLAQITPFFFYSIGGYLVIKGDLSFGALVAVLAAYKDLTPPWKELLNYYQAKEDARVKYELLVDMFDPPGLLDEGLQGGEPDRPMSLIGPLVASNLPLSEREEGDVGLEGTLTLRLGLPARVAVVGAAGSGKERLAEAIAGIRRAARGSLRLNQVELASAPESVTGRRIGFVGPEVRLRTGSVRDNLLYGLRHRPMRPARYEGPALVEWQRRCREARMSGNNEDDLNADWTDYEGAGLSGPEELMDRVSRVLTLADLEHEVYHLGLQATIDPEIRSDLAERILAARAALRSRLESREHAPLVELFDRDAYNTNMSVAENLLFGTPRDPGFDAENLGANPYVRKVLHESGLTEDFLHIGRKVAELMVDLFADVEPGSDLFDQFSFIRAEDLPAFRPLLVRSEGRGYEDLDPADRQALVALPFKLVVARHRLGLVGEEMQARILGARRLFARGFGDGSPPVDLFDPQRYNPAVSLQDNILFGRLAHGRAGSQSRIGELIREVVDQLGLRRDIVECGLDVSVGVGGSRLSGGQRQKLAIARALLKRPDLLVLEEATVMLDGASHARIAENLLEELAERALIWVLHRASLAERFDEVVVMDGGQVVEQGRYEDLNRPGTVFHGLVTSD